MPVSDYLSALQRQLATGQAGEHAYRPALKALLEAVTGLLAVNEPRRIAVGAPDFILLRGQVPIGFVEAKDLDADLSRIERSEQVQRYRAALVQAGAALIDLHLLRSPALDNLVTTFPVGGDHIVERGHPRYVEAERRVYINRTQYFEGVEPEVWAFQVGGYQVLEKWLKDRRGRRLSWDDVQHYQRVVVALTETLRLMEEIDGLVPAWPLE